MASPASRPRIVVDPIMPGMNKGKGKMTIQPIPAPGKAAAKYRSIKKTKEVNKIYKTY